MQPSEGRLLGLDSRGFHRLSYVEWGAAGRESVICVHALSRNARDFDALAQALCDRRRVVCPDMPGRGKSDWLAEKSDYAMPLYMADCTALLARLGVEHVDWVGTSMGGIIGMLMAGRPNTPIRRLVLNDVGPFIPAAALKRISGYVGTDPHFASVEEGEAWMRRVMTTFGPLTDEDWRHLVMHGLRADPGGGFRLHYDPGIAKPMFDGGIEDVDLWAVWDAIRCPVLVIRGAESDLLPHEVVEEMKRRGPGCEVITYEGVGHAPMLMSREQIAPVVDWLESPG